MPRLPRQYSESGFYHVMLRGNGKQIIFEDDADRRFFLKLLREKTEADGVAIIAWCLMSNHVHLLIDDPKGSISHVMHAVSTAYARHFNDKTGHLGAVFQGRFTSVPIADDNQLLQALRYIHENPAKAGVAAVSEYPWSSYGEYRGRPGIANTEIVLDMVGGTNGFLRFCNDGQFGSYYFRSTSRASDEDALEVLRCTLGGIEPVDIKKMPKEQRNRALQSLRAAGLTVKQMQRLTGIGHNTISRVTKGVSWGRVPSDPFEEGCK